MVFARFCIIEECLQSIDSFIFHSRLVDWAPSDLSVLHSKQCVQPSCFSVSILEGTRHVKDLSRYLMTYDDATIPNQWLNVYLYHLKCGFEGPITLWFSKMLPCLLRYSPL